jgi:GNAT superfamily N-acetyltransferase
MIPRRLFSTLATRAIFHFEMVKATHETINMLHNHRFSLAHHFNLTLANKQDWRKTEHQLLIVKTSSNKPVAFAGIEIGEGDTIQTYIEKCYREQIFHHKTCLLHTMEVHPEYRKRGFQMFLWKKLCEWAQTENVNSVIWEPRDEETYRSFLNKFNLTHKEILLSKIIEHGDYFDGESTRTIVQEEVINYFQLEQCDFNDFQNKLEAATKNLRVENDPCEYKMTCSNAFM